jgi:1-acyl-sn-glycerol-3-phosphate acyltransferase
MSNSEAHRIAREQGVSPGLYRLARVLLTPLFRIWLRLRSAGADRVPLEGPVILAPNHKSEWDRFLVASCIPRRMRFMAKAELFRPPVARPLLRLGAFPVRRGRSDTEAIATARSILEQGGALLLFPEASS